MYCLIIQEYFLAVSLLQRDVFDFPWRTEHFMLIVELL
jgi:hypothetical protein